MVELIAARIAEQLQADSVGGWTTSGHKMTTAYIIEQRRPTDITTTTDRDVQTTACPLLHPQQFESVSKWAEFNVPLDTQ